MNFLMKWIRLSSMSSLRFAGAIFISACCAAVAQTGDNKHAFEVASVKASGPLTSSPYEVSFSPASGRLRAVSATLYLLILRAFDVKAFQVSGGPSWLTTELYDVEAKAVGPASEDELRTMLQALLAERFQLKVRREMKEVSMYRLTVDKSGLKVNANPEPSGRPQVTVSRTQIVGHNATFATLVPALSKILGTPVLDETGVMASYDFKLDYDASSLPGRFGAPVASSAGQTDPIGPSIFTALKSGLGLALSLGKAPVQMLMIENAQRPAGN